MAYPNKDRYTPNHGTAGNSNWQEGDYVTAANMNHIEDGIDQALQNAEDYAQLAAWDARDVAQSYAINNCQTNFIDWSFFSSETFFWEAMQYFNLNTDHGAIIRCFGMGRLNKTAWGETEHDIYLTGFVFEDKAPSKLLLFGFDFTSDQILTALPFEFGNDFISGPMGSGCYITQYKLNEFSDE